MIVTFLLRCPAGSAPDKAGLPLADRCHSLSSLYLPQAALASLPQTRPVTLLRQLKKKYCHSEEPFGDEESP